MLCGVRLVCGRGHLHGVGERFTRLETTSAGGSIGVTIAVGVKIAARCVASALRLAALHMTAADVAFFNPARVASALPASITFETGLARSAAAACSCRFIGLRAAICCLFGWFGAILHGILCDRYTTAKRQNCPERGNV